MITLILGGGGSGKSAHAESMVVLNGSDTRYYLATMATSDEESLRRISRHQKMRQGKGFHTIECPVRLEDIRRPQKGDVLLECMSNLVANELFEPEGRREHTADLIMEGVCSLEAQAGHLFIVSNNVFEDGLNYPGDTENYLQILAEVNRRVAERASLVVESVQGIPVIWKSDNTACKHLLHTESDMMRENMKNGPRAFITGGSYQGKREWALNYWKEINHVAEISEDAVWNGENGLPESWEGICILDKLHQLVRRYLEQEKDPRELAVLLAEKKDLIIITDEVGCGLVPLTEFERNWRDGAGRIGCEIAAASHEVYRMTSGIAQRIR